jgi:Methyltransferase domain
MDVLSCERGKRVEENMTPTDRRAARYWYLSARLCSLLGMSAAARTRYRKALVRADHRKARKRLASLNLPGEDYFKILLRLHAHLRPRTYMEIGVFKGKSLRLADDRTCVIGVDPAPQLKRPAGPNTIIFSQPSDEYFAEHDVRAELGGLPVDMALIDGMHQFEYALRDFMNLERICAPGSVILIHDCYPVDAASAARERSTVFWTGDIWRLILILKKYRPELSVHTIATAPSGLGIVMNLDPTSAVLRQDFEAIVADARTVDYATIEADQAEALNLVSNDWAKIRTLLDTRRSN